jgi:hypothetical protein
MRLLEKEEKIAFMKVLYTFVMRDDKRSPEEKRLLDSFRDTVFKLNKEGVEDYEWMVNLGSSSHIIAKEIDKIEDPDTKERLILILMAITSHSEKAKGFIFKKIENNERNFIRRIIDFTSLDNETKKGLHEILKDI